MTAASNNRYFTFLCDIFLLMGFPETFPSAAPIIFMTQATLKQEITVCVCVSAGGDLVPVPGV